MAGDNDDDAGKTVDIHTTRTQEIINANDRLLDMIPEYAGWILWMACK